MKSFSDAAVFGLVPVPPMHAAPARRVDADRHVLDEDAQGWQSTPGQPGDSERVAPKEELARLRRELGVKVDPQPK
jgi:hypothetical protein